MDVALTSRRDVVSRMKNMLMMPRYLMIRVPGRKESGVILTTETVLLGNGRIQRKDRERPSGSGLPLSWEAAGGGGAHREQTHSLQRVSWE